MRPPRTASLRHQSASIIDPRGRPIAATALGPIRMICSCGPQSRGRCVYVCLSGQHMCTTTTTLGLARLLHILHLLTHSSRDRPYPLIQYSPSFFLSEVAFSHTEIRYISTDNQPCYIYTVNHQCPSGIIHPSQSICESNQQQQHQWT